MKMNTEFLELQGDIFLQLGSKRFRVGCDAETLKKSQNRREVMVVY